MGLLDKLWDDVVAGPQPDQGLSRLRRNPKLQFDEETVDEEFIAGRRRSSEFLRHQEETRRVAQSIPILKRPPRLRIDSLDMDYTDSAPSTPGAPSTPSSSFAASPFSNFDRERVQRKAASVPCSPALGSHDVPEREIGWSSVFHSGSVRTMKKSIPEKIDKQTPNPPTVYDWVVLSALDR